MALVFPWVLYIGIPATIVLCLLRFKKKDVYENGKRVAERIIDFLYGVSLPLNLYVARVNETTFIFSKEHLNG